MADVFKSPADQSDQLLVDQEKKERTGNKHPGVFYVDKAGKRWTYDDPEIRAAFKELNRRGLEEATMYEDPESGQIVDLRDDARKAKGEDWIRQETADQTKRWNPQKQKQIHFIFGNGGTGKSSYIRNNDLNNGAYLMDSDEFVENRIDDSNKSNPERALNTYKVHEESSWLRNKMFEPLIQQGFNIVNPKVKPKLSDIKRFKDLGYRVSGTFLDADLDTSLNRGLKRYVEDRNRLVPTSAYVDPVKLRKMWQELVDSGLMDEWDHYDANDPNYALKLLASSKNK